VLEPVPEKQRQFAAEAVRRLRAAGFTAYWAGGCVRDQLLNRVPKDYDVATDATPPQIRELFGRRRTLALGAAFGVITVLGPEGAGQIEVATFRQETTYSDGRHPDSVRFSTAEEDALRRDFTINGMFYDPIDERVIDFVGGQEDLGRRLVRAIGDPHERISEDKLRMLRAIRFAAVFDFELESETRQAVRRRAGEITVVSAERIAAEMRQMLVHVHRVRAVRLLLDTGLANAVLPEIVPADEDGEEALARSLAVLARLEGPSLPVALAALLVNRVDRDNAEEICRRWRLSNKEINTTGWLLGHHDSLRDARSKRWSQLQPVIIAEEVHELLTLGRAEALAGFDDLEEVEWCRSLLERPREELDPKPLVTGDDLKEHGVPPGPAYRRLLERVREAQLDGEIHDRTEALALVDRILNDEQHERV
jgi:tRNA nucleotidyltransferase/poly(A) polymerase